MGARVIAARTAARAHNADPFAREPNGSELVTMERPAAIRSFVGRAADVLGYGARSASPARHADGLKLREREIA